MSDELNTITLQGMLAHIGTQDPKVADFAMQMIAGAGSDEGRAGTLHLLATVFSAGYSLGYRKAQKGPEQNEVPPAEHPEGPA